MKRPLLLSAAALFLGWESVAVALWLRAGGGPASFWAAVSGDWMALLFFTDMAVFSLICVVWIARDARGRGMSAGATAAWAGAAVVLGSPVLLVYLAQRANASASREDCSRA